MNYCEIKDEYRSKNLSIKKIGSIFLMFFFFCFSFSQKLSTSVEPLKIKIGEPIAYTLQIHVQNNRRILPSLENQLRNSKFELLSYTIDTTRQAINYHLALTCFEAGKQKIPSFELPVENEMLKTSSYEIEVSEVPVDENKPFQEIKPIEEVELTWQETLIKYLPWIGGFFIFLLFALLLWWIFRKKKGKNKVTRSLTLYEKTILRLKKLQEEDYLEKENYKSYYVTLAEIVREYVAERYQVPAKVLLTSDLMEFLQKKEILSEKEYRTVRELLQMSDNVKFAKFKPTRPLAEGHLNEAIGFVEDSKKNQELEQLQEDVKQENKGLKIRKI